MNENNTEQTVSDRSTEFVAVEGGQETASAGGLLVTAYIIMWVAVFVFVWMTRKRLGGISSRLTDLEVALKKADGAAPPPPA